LKDYNLPKELELPTGTEIKPEELGKQFDYAWMGKHGDGSQKEIPQTTKVDKLDWKKFYCFVCGSKFEDKNHPKENKKCPNLVECIYPLCQENQKEHSTKVCSTQMKMAKECCNWRGHGKEAHQMWSPLDLAYTFLKWAMMNNLLVLTFAEMSRKDKAYATEAMWRNSLFDKHRKHSQKLLSIYEISFDENWKEVAQAKTIRTEEKRPNQYRNFKKREKGRKRANESKPDEENKKPREDKSKVTPSKTGSTEKDKGRRVTFQMEESENKTPLVSKIMRRQSEDQINTNKLAENLLREKLLEKPPPPPPLPEQEERIVHLVEDLEEIPMPEDTWPGNPMGRTHAEWSKRLDVLRQEEEAVAERVRNKRERIREIQEEIDVELTDIKIKRNLVHREFQDWVMLQPDGFQEFKEFAAKMEAKEKEKERAKKTETETTKEKTKFVYSSRWTNSNWKERSEARISFDRSRLGTRSKRF
jgi:hypothetical protein